MRSFLIKIKNFIIENYDPIIIGCIILFFMWKFIFYPNLFQVIYESIKEFFKK